MNVLLVYPEYPKTFWSFKYVLSYVLKKAAYPPLGLLTIASMLPKEWKKRLIDCNVKKLAKSDIAWADMVFVSAMIAQKSSVVELTKIFRTEGKLVVAGGPLFTSSVEEFENIDHFVLNEGEVTLPLFLEDLKLGCPKKIYQSDVRPDVTKTAIPMWSLIDMRKYHSMLIQFSRGCPFNCEFCGIIAMNGREPRTKSSGQVIAELDSLYRAGWRGSVFFVDDNFIGNRAKVNEVLKHIIEWQRNHRFPFVFMTEASLNLANDDEIMHLMSQANFDSVFIGIETPCIESLKECGKHQNVNVDVAQAIKKIHKRGMQVLGGFILGFDSDNDSIFQTQIDFIQKIGVAMAMVGLLNALPNTRLWYRLKEEGRLTGATSGENTDGSMNFIPRMGEDKLKKGYRKVLNTIYCPKSYFQRVSKFLSDYKPTAKTEIKPAQVYAFVRSIWSIGILSRARFRYWKILINTMLFNFRALPAAITLSIFWLHFSKVAHNIE